MCHDPACTLTPVRPNVRAEPRGRTIASVRVDDVRYGPWSEVDDLDDAANKAARIAKIIRQAEKADMNVTFSKA